MKQKFFHNFHRKYNHIFYFHASVKFKFLKLFIAIYKKQKVTNRFL